MSSPSPTELTPREREVLRLVVRNFIATAGPVGSRYLAKHSALGLSPASIRNTMSDLEELGYLGHPYTSAGRVPTELGYRKFVDELMETPTLSPAEKRILREELEKLLGDTEQLAHEGSRLLGRLSNLLGVALTPRLSTGTLERLEVVPLSSSRVMFVLSVRGGLVRTIVFELDTDLTRDDLDRVVERLNERLAGLSLEEIRHSYEPRLRDLPDDKNGIIRLVLDEAPNLFSEQPEGRLRHAGTRNLLDQPEFQAPDELRNLIQIIEDEGAVVRLLEAQRGHAHDAEPGRAVITIGSESGRSEADNFSIVTARYQLGEAVGTVGVIGPMRMAYGRVVSLVEGMAALLNRPAPD